MQALSRGPAVVDAYRNDPLVLGQGTPHAAMRLIAEIDRTLADVEAWLARHL